MTSTIIKQPTLNKDVTKPVKNDIKLDLDSILDQTWNLGLPNGILNVA